MRQLVFSFAMLIAASGGASAQSVLERVLNEIDGASNLTQVNGIYANIAENVGATGTTTTVSVPATFETAPANTILWAVEGPSGAAFIRVADLGTTYTAGDGGIGDELLGGTGIESITLLSDGSWAITDLGGDGTGLLFWSPMEDDVYIYGTDFTSTLSQDMSTAAVYDLTSRVGDVFLISSRIAEAYGYLDYVVTVDETTTEPGLTPDIDGSITNLIAGVSTATAQAVAGTGSATVFSIPTVDLGDMTTTVLGAVNTGEIALGVNSAVDEASTSTTRAISAAMTQIGGSADTGALVLNVASNAGSINGSIQNTMIAVNGSIGSTSTTTLGAVNTGTITSGVNAAVQGIVGQPGQASSGL